MATPNAARGPRAGRGHARSVHPEQLVATSNDDLDVAEVIEQRRARGQKTTLESNMGMIADQALAHRWWPRGQVNGREG